MVLCRCLCVTVIPIRLLFMEPLHDVYLWQQSLYAFCTVKKSQLSSCRWRPRLLFSIGCTSETRSRDMQTGGMRELNYTWNLVILQKNGFPCWIGLPTALRWSPPRPPLEMSAGENGKNRSEGASEKFQIERRGGLWVQHMRLTSWLLRFRAQRDPAVELVKEGTAAV